MTRTIPDPGFAGDDGGVDPRLAAALAALLNGCAAVGSLGTTHEDELQKLYPGQPRAEVQRLLGTPQLQQPLSNGWSQERYELKLRDDASAMQFLVPGWKFDAKRPALDR